MNIVLFLLFSIPAVQKRAANIALEKIQPIIDTHLSLDGVRIRLFNKVQLNGLYVEDQQQDTLLYTGSLTVRIHPWDLLSNRVTVQHLSMEDFVASVYRESSDEPFNFQFIINSFAGEKETTAAKKEKKSWRISSEDIDLKNGTLRYHILAAPRTPGTFNPNHFDVQDFNLRARVDFQGIEDMQAEITKLTLLESNTGLNLGKLLVHFRSAGTRFESDRVELAFNQTELSVRDAYFDRDTKEFAAVVRSDRTDPADIALFAPRLSHLDKPLSFNLDAEGTLPSAALNCIDFRYGQGTRFTISGEISDYTNLSASNLNVQIKTLSVSQDDLESFIRIGANGYSSPNQLTALGDIDLKMNATGRLPHFRYNGQVETEQGDVLLHGTGRITDGFKRLVFEGPVSTSDIVVSRIIGDNAGVGNTTLHADASVTIQQGEGVSVTANGTIESTSYKGYPYRDLFFDGVYSGKDIAASVNTDTELNKLEVAADLSFGDEKRIKVDGMIDRLDIRPFIMMEGWKTPSLSTRIDAQFSGKTMDDMAGSLLLDRTSLVDSSFYYNPGPIYLQALVNEGEEKKIEIMSSLLEGEITGDYYFSCIGNDLMQVLRPHLPSLVTARADSSAMELPYQGKNNFNFNFLLKNTEDISYVFSFPFYNVEQATIKGYLNSKNGRPFYVDAHIPRIIVGKNDVRETKLDLASNRDAISLDLNSYLVQDKGHTHAKLKSTAALDSVVNHLGFELQQTNTKSKGELLISMGFLSDPEERPGIHIHVHPTAAVFNEKGVQINDATIDYRKEEITIRNFGIRQDEMLLLGIEGIASKSEEDNIRLYFNNTEIANILAAFNVYSFTGSLNGEIFVRQALETPMIHTEELRIEDIAVYKDTIGTLRIEGNWNQLYSGLNLDAYLENGEERSLEVKGYVPTGDASPVPMDVNFTVDNFDLRSIQPLTTTVFSELTGHMNSRIHLGGRLSEPIAEGWLGIDKGSMRVAYTNVTYHLSDTIHIGKDNVGLENLVIRDQNNKTAMLNVQLSHSNFGRMAYTAGIYLDDFMLLNNRNRTDLMAYGSLRLSGELHIAGSPAGIFGDGRVFTKSLSDVTVVLPQTAKATEYSGIVYINTPSQDSLSFLRRDNELSNRVNTRTASGIPIVMRATIDLNPLLTAGVIIDPTTGNSLEVSGEGELNVNFNSKSTPPVRLYGDYVINEGDFHYNVQNLRAIDFSIREGSRLTMAGNPLNTQFNITAFLPVRADLSTLSSTFAHELKNTRVPVNALLRIRGDLQAMDLQYDIELPESSSDIQQRVNSFINTEETKILQFAYLVTTGSFIPSEGSPDINFGSSMFTNFAANTLSRGLDALFASALSDNWTISTNLESVDGTLDNARMGVDVSTRLLNNRLRISTNLSYGDKSLLASQQAFMGEFELEYDINNWLMLRAYNRANERFSSRAPVTQGVGFMVTKEGQSLRNLLDFRFVRPKEDE